MAFTYTTEYCLGRRGRINRSYTGMRALIAIAFDLGLAFSFGLVGLGISLVRACIVTLSRFIGILLRFPFQRGLPLLWDCVVIAYRLGVAIIRFPLRVVGGRLPVSRRSWHCQTCLGVI